MWKAIFEYVFTPLVIFIGGYIFLRIAGKKAVSEMTSFDILFVIVMGTIIAGPIFDDNLFRAMFYSVAYLVLYVVFNYASLNNKLRWWINPSPTVLIRNGDIDEKGLKKSKIAISQLLAELRIKGYTKTSDVELAIMEEMGQISVIPKSHARPLKPVDICLHPSPEFIPIPVIMDGQIIDHNLKYMKKDRNWLDEQLSAYSMSKDELESITLAVINQKGYIEVDTNSKKDNAQGPYAYKPGNDN